MLDLLVELGFVPAVLRAGGVTPVDRATLLATGTTHDVYWTRPAPASAEPAVDPTALAI